MQYTSHSCPLPRGPPQTPGLASLGLASIFFFFKERKAFNKVSITNCFQCLKRDGCICILTGAACPDVCHIVPFALNSNDKNLHDTNRFLRILRLFAKQGEMDHYKRVLGTELGSSDKAWNMLSISPELHRYWSSACWGLKSKGLTFREASAKWTITLQFQWLLFPNRVDPEKIIDMDPDSSDCQDWLLRLRTPGEGENPDLPGYVRAWSGRSHHPLASGQQFDIILDTYNEAVEMERMIDIQWTCVTLAAMGGLAGPTDLDDDFSEFEYQKVAYRQAHREELEENEQESEEGSD